MAKITLGKNDLFSLLTYLNIAQDFDIFIVDPEEYEDIAFMLATDDVPLESIVETFLKHNRVIFVELFLAQNDFIITTTEIMPEYKGKFIQSENVMLNVEMGDTLYMISLNKVIVKRSQKTMAELEYELEVAVKNEDYKEAIKLREKLKKRKERKKK